MSRTQEPEDDPESAQTQSNDQTQQPLVIVALVMRFATLIALILTISLLASDSITYVSDFTFVIVNFHQIYAYRYALTVSVIGLIHALTELPFSTLRLMKVKDDMPSNSPKLLAFYFVADKVIMLLLATGVGAAFGSTIDLKRNLDKINDVLELSGDTDFSYTTSKLDDFFNRAYFPAVFLLVGVVTSGVSSLLSSLALIKK